MPAPPLIISDVIEVTVEQSLGSTRPTNTFFVRNDTAADFQGAWPNILPIFQDFYLDIASELSTTWSVESFTFRDRGADPGQVTVQAPTVAVAGDDAGAIIPRQTALVVSLRTLFAGPRYRGRVYLCGFTEDKNDVSGIPLASAVTTIQAAADELISDLDTANYPLVVVSRGYNPGPPETTWTPFATAVVSATVDSRWDTQRRRRLT